MKRRNFLVAPLLATVSAGATAATFANFEPSKILGHAQPSLTLLQLDEGGGSFAQLPRHDARWRLPLRNEPLARARVTLHGFINGTHAPQAVHVQALFRADDGARLQTHDVLRYFAAAHLENGKPVGFDASQDAFRGFRIVVSRVAHEPAQIAQTDALDLETGTYSLVFGSTRDALAMTRDDRAWSGMKRALPSYLIFSIAAT